MFFYSKFDGYDCRRFSYSHLAQLKFILPEAIMLKKVVVFDERTSCMKPDLHISFNFGVLESKEDQYMQLRKLFRTRLSEFVSSHPEVCHHFLGRKCENLWALYMSLLVLALFSTGLEETNYVDACWLLLFSNFIV